MSILKNTIDVEELNIRVFMAILMMESGQSLSQSSMSHRKRIIFFKTSSIGLKNGRQYFSRHYRIQALVSLLPYISFRINNISIVIGHFISKTEGVTGPVRFYNNERKASFLLNQFQNGKEVKIGEYSSLLSHLDLTRGEPLRWVISFLK